MQRAASVFACLAVVSLAPSFARADEADACIAAAEQSQPLQAAGHLRAARDLLLVCSKDACPRVVRSDCKKWLAAVDASEPSIVVQARNRDGGKLADVAVTVDGAPLAGRVDGEPVSIDAGDHVIRAQRDGGAGQPLAQEQHVTIRRGEHARAITFTFDVPSAAGTSHGGPSEGAPTEPPPDAPGSRRPIPAVAWVTAGVGVAALAGGAALWAVGLSERSALYAGCGQTAAKCTSSQVDTSRAKLVAGDVTFGAGIVAAGVAVWMGIRAKTSAPPAIGVDVGHGWGVVTYGGRF